MNDSFTNQDSSHYSTAPYNWIVDSELYNIPLHSNNAAGLFAKSDNPLANHIDKESDLINLDQIIGRYDIVDADALQRAKTFSDGLQKVYDVQNNIQIVEKQHFLNNTRLTQPAESITEKNYNRWEFLPYDHQVPEHIIDPNRGGTWSRNEFKDNYTCSVADSRGGNK